MTTGFEGIQLTLLTVLMLHWLTQLFVRGRRLSTRAAMRLEAGLLLAIMIVSALSALRLGQQPWFELWYAEQIAALMIATILMRLCMQRHRRLIVRIVIGLGICGWLAMATIGGLHHQPIWPI